MARLTRTQKFADYRDSIANSKEPSVSTDTLASYENRLNNVTETLSPNPVTQNYQQPQPQMDVNYQPQPQMAANYQQPQPQMDVNYQQPQVQVEQNYQQPQPQMDVNYQQPQVQVEQNYQQPQPVAPQASVQETVQTYATNNLDQPKISEIDIDALLRGEDTSKYTYETNNQTQDNIGNEFNTYATSDDDIENYFSTVSEQLGSMTTEIPVFEGTGNMETYTSDLPVMTDDFINSFEEEVQAQPQVEPTYQTPVEPQPTVETVENVQPEQTVNTSILNEAINDANTYNQLNGEKTIDQVASSIIHDVRNDEREIVLDADEVVAPVNEQAKADEDFSNTVSMEISKIMDEMNKPEETKQEAPVEEIITERPDEEVVEIKNFKEIEKEQVKENTISETIPFIVTDNDELIDDEEEEGSNTILNIILIVLIIILVAVLGLIIFYILKTKNIL